MSEIAQYSPEWFANKAKEDQYVQFEEYAKKVRRNFIEKFGLNWLKSLHGKDLLEKVFLGHNNRKGNLCHTLEYDKDIASIFGSIKGGTSLKYGLYFSKGDNQWVTTSSTKTRYLTEDEIIQNNSDESSSKKVFLTEEEAIKVATLIRDEIVKGADVIHRFGNVTNIEDYKKLYLQLEKIGEIDKIWVLKYYQMLFPNVLPIFYGDNYRAEVLGFIDKSLSLENEKFAPFIQMGQIELFIKKCGIPSEVFGRIYYDILDAESDGKRNIMPPSNIILYGPPGTGKTYSVAAVVQLIRNGMEPTAQAIAEFDTEELKAAKIEFSRELKDKNGHVAFTTFHQSFAYEEFIEGIRPVMNNNESETSDIKYETKPGIFKAFCERAAKPIAIDASSLEINDQPTIWKVSLAGTGDNPVRTECLENNHIRIGWDGYGSEITDETVFNEGGKKVLDRLYNRIAEGDIILSCYSAKTIDAIGVAKEKVYWDDSYDKYKRVREVKWLVKGINYNIVDKFSVPTMTLSTIYRLKLDISNVIEILKEYKAIPADMMKKNDEPYFFIIDEINRGNISKIFGELITLIETSKREGCDDEQSTILPFSGEQFSVPANVHIIGTMNTADRSIALIDTALRRRFDFIEMLPQHELLDNLEIEGIHIGKMLEIINNRIEALYDREHSIGHAYFMGLASNQTLEALAGIFKKKVLPLLQEYFFEDYEKIRLVLGDNQKSNNQFQFVRKENIDYETLFGDQESELFDNELIRYVINEDAFNDPNSYIGIYS